MTMMKPSDSEHARKAPTGTLLLYSRAPRQAKLTPVRRDAGDFVMDRIIPEAELFFLVSDGRVQYVVQFHHRLASLGYIQ